MIFIPVHFFSSPKSLNEESDSQENKTESDRYYNYRAPEGTEMRNRYAGYPAAGTWCEEVPPPPGMKGGVI